MDDQNSLFCSIENQHRIIKISLNEQIKEVKLIAGTGCADPLLHMLDHPNGIYVNDNFTLFVADTNNHRILQFHQNETNGIAIAGFGSSSLFLLNKPTSIAFDGNSVLYIVHSLNHRIVRLLSNGLECLFGCSNELNNPQSISSLRGEGEGEGDASYHDAFRSNAELIADGFRFLIILKDTVE